MVEETNAEVAHLLHPVTPIEEPLLMAVGVGVGGADESADEPPLAEPLRRLPRTPPSTAAMTMTRTTATAERIRIRNRRFAAGSDSARGVRILVFCAGQPRQLRTTVADMSRTLISALRKGRDSLVSGITLGSSNPTWQLPYLRFNNFQSGLIIMMEVEDLREGLALHGPPFRPRNSVETAGFGPTTPLSSSHGGIPGSRMEEVAPIVATNEVSRDATRRLMSR